MSAGSEVEIHGREGRFERPPEFRCEVRERDEAAVVELHGELDLATAPEAEARLHQLAGEKKRVTVDLRGLTFLDSTGLSMLVRLDALARQDGFNFSVVRGSPPVQRAIEISGLDEVLVLVDDPDDLNV